jgi:hypothetical protein
VTTGGKIFLAVIALLCLGRCVAETHCIVTTGGDCGSGGVYDPY